MELKQLISFVSVADTKSMKIASTRCNISISAVSKHIKALEDELGVELFERKKNEILITESGADFLPHARIIINEAKTYSDELASKRGTLYGELRIGVGSFITPYIRTAAMEFMKRYPNVQIKANFDRTEVLNKMLRSGELDIAFTMNNAYHHEGIISKPCIPFHLSAIMPKHHELAGKDIVTYDDLMRCRIVMPDCGERVFQTFQKYMPHDLSKLPVSCIVTNAGEALSILDRMNMVTFLPSQFIEDKQNLIAKPIESLEMELTSNAHWLKEVPLKASAREFLRIIREIQSK